jgi:hypothetical protein
MSSGTLPQTTKTLLSTIGALLVFALMYQAGLHLAHGQYTRSAPDSMTRELGHALNALACREVGYVKACEAPAAKVQRDPELAHSTNARQYLASLPDLATALTKLQWLGGDDAAAVRFLSVMHAVRMGRGSEHARVADVMKPLMQPIWEAYPQITSASVCTFCGAASTISKQFASEQTLDDKISTRMSRNHVDYFVALTGRVSFTPDEAHQLATTYAQLSSGDNRTLVAIANFLAEQHEYAALRIWVTNNMNGGFALDGIPDLSSVPRDVLIAAWERSASAGYDSRKLTEYLMKTGYRPTLRFVVWMQDGAANYLSSKNSRYARERGRYAGLLSKYTNFPELQGRLLGEYYSTNWREIKWDSEHSEWRQVRQ